MSMQGPDDTIQRDLSVDSFSPEIKSDEDQPTTRPNELASIAEIQCYLGKYSTTSSVFAEQSVSNPDYQKTLYCISCILQAELFDDLPEAARYPQNLNPELNIVTTLPPHLGGLQPKIPEEVLARETADDMELRVELEAGTVPTVDTILRFISWLHQSAQYSAQCNIIAFIYIKRMMDSKCILTMNNWRGMWLGCIMLAQKVWDDGSLRTSSFAEFMQGVTKHHLKALERKILQLLDFATLVKPSIYARFYFELREIFKTITGELVQNSNPDNRSGMTGRRRPLTVKNASLLRTTSEDPRLSSRQCSRQTSRNRSNVPSGLSSGFVSGTQSRASHAPTATAWATSSARPVPVDATANPQSHQRAGSADYSEGPATHSTQESALSVQQSPVASTTITTTTTTTTTVSGSESDLAQPPLQSSLPLSLTAITAMNLHGRSVDDGAGTGHRGASAASSVAGDNPLLHFGNPTAVSTPGNVRSPKALAARANKPLSTTYEDFTYTKSSIYVIS